MPPALVHLGSEKEYLDYYEQHYCRAVITTFDGIRVYFPRSQFKDAFYESQNRRAKDKSLFATDRAQRIDWIRVALEDPNAELYAGWDRDQKKSNPKRRVSLVYGDYVVIIDVRWNQKGKLNASFITAYPLGKESLALIRSGGKWEWPK